MIELYAYDFVIMLLVALRELSLYFCGKCIERDFEKLSALEEFETWLI